MFEQDYVMRMIKELVRAILKFTCNIDTETPTVDLLETEQQRKASKLITMLDDDKIREAEGQLSSVVDNENIEDLKLAIFFYSYLNDKDDDYLARNGLTREDIMSGLQNTAVKYGLKDLADMF